MITRFMEVMFSNTDEELAKQVDEDIKTAQKGEPVDTEELKYEKTDNGDVAITDKENGEVTIAAKSEEDADTYDLVAVPDGQLERFVHPSADGKPGDALGAPDEKVADHFTDGSVISPNLPDGGLNPDAGNERKVVDLAKQGPQPNVCPECGKASCECEEANDEREFSVTSDNAAWQKIFSWPLEFADRIFSEVIESSESSKVGDLKIDKCPDEDDAVVVTSEATGDQVKVKLDGEDMEVTELESKNFGEAGQYLPIIVVGVQPYEHIIVEAQEYDMESAEELKARLEKDGVEAIQIFDDLDSARDYAHNLYEGLGANPAVGDVDEPVEQKEYSAYYDCPAFFTASYRTPNSVFMTRIFSEQAEGIAETRDLVEEAINSGEEVDLDGATIIPIDAQNAIIQDGEEATLATLSGLDMVLEKLDEDDIEEILNDDESIIEAKSDINDQVNGTAGKDGYDDDEEEEDEEKEFSDVWTNNEETRFFSESEDMTNYMIRLFSEEADQEVIEQALENGKQIENDDEIVTPVSADTAIIEDKENGEFTKATIKDDVIDVNKISDEEAEKLTKNLKVEDNDEDLEEKEDEEKEFSDVWTNNEETRFFSEGEDMTNYMVRLFSEEADQDAIEAAIEDGEPVETEEEIITPIDDETAVVEDKGNGEFTKVTLLDEDRMNVHPISDDEAKNLLENEEEEDEEKEFSDVWTNNEETRFFSEGEDMTDYMVRLFSEESDQEVIEQALENGKQIENDNEVVTPVSADTAIIEDKENGEFTKATVKDDVIDVNKISEEEADELTKNLKVEDNDEDLEEKDDDEEEEEKDDEKEFSDPLDKFFADVVQAAQPAAVPAPAVVDAQPAAPAPAPTAAPVQEEVPAEDPNAAAPVPSVEEIEDKAVAAVESIKAAAAEASAQIMEAKAAPAPTEEADIQEAQFSEKTFSQNVQNDTLVTWLQYK